MIFVLNKKIPLKSDILHFRKKIKIFWFFPKMKKFWFLPYHRCTANRQTIYRWSLVAQKVFKCEVFIWFCEKTPKINCATFFSAGGRAFSRTAASAKFAHSLNNTFGQVLLTLFIFIVCLWRGGFVQRRWRRANIR